MKMIVAVSDNWGIGLNGRLLFSIPEDMKYFKEKTMGSMVIMGRSTLESFSGAKPLSGRENIILSSNVDLSVDGAIIVHDLKELFDKVDQYKDDVYVIGGASIYKQLEPYCDQALVTKVSAAPPADKFFPNLDNMPNWELIDDGSEKRHDELTYKFMLYKNKAIKHFD